MEEVIRAILYAAFGWCGGWLGYYLYHRIHCVGPMICDNCHYRWATRTMGSIPLCRKCFHTRAAEFAERIRRA